MIAEERLWKLLMGAGCSQPIRTEARHILREAVEAEAKRRNAAWRQIVNEGSPGRYTWADLMALGWRVNALMQSDATLHGGGNDS